MSERYAIAVDFDVMFSQEGARQLFRVMASAVSANWSQARDQFAHPHPDLPVEPDRWAELCTPESMHSLAGNTRYEFLWFYFSFSPLSTAPLKIVVAEESDGHQSATLWIPPGLHAENRGDRERDRMLDEATERRKGTPYDTPDAMGPPEDAPDCDEWWDTYMALDGLESVWPENKQCLERVVTALRDLFPVREFQISKKLMELGFTMPGATPREDIL